MIASTANLAAVPPVLNGAAYAAPPGQNSAGQDDAFAPWMRAHEETDRTAQPSGDANPARTTSAVSADRSTDTTTDSTTADSTTTDATAADATKAASSAAPAASVKENNAASDADATTLESASTAGSALAETAALTHGGPSDGTQWMAVKGKSSTALASALRVSKEGIRQDKSTHADAVASAVTTVAQTSNAGMQDPASATQAVAAVVVPQALNTGETSTGAGALQRVAAGRSAATVASGNAQAASAGTQPVAPDALRVAPTADAAADGDVLAEGMASQSVHADSGTVAAQHSSLTSAEATPTVSPDATFAYSFTQHGGSDSARSGATQTSMSSMSSTVSDSEPAATAHSTAPLRHLDVSVDDGVLGTVGVRAEMRDGVLHASISGGTDVAAAMPELHQFLQQNDIAIHTVVQHVAQPVRVSDGSTLSSSGDGGVAQNSSSDSYGGGAQTGSGNTGNSGSQSGGNTPMEDRSAVQSVDVLRSYLIPSPSSFDSGPSFTGADAPQGSRLSIHI